MKSIKGFTLIELMVVIAIIGLLSAIGVASYQNYVARAQINRVVSELSSYKLGVERLLITADFDMNNDKIYFQESNLIVETKAQNIADFSSQDDSGSLEVNLGGDASSSIVGAKVGLYRDQIGSWSCIVDSSSAKNFKASYLPDGCKTSL